ncbi:unnamed protein product [Protopolystoma xenopodis]|uniref:Uncharacterized protein n=1 Tax=Protopolystoma xenopodis TaxID=117903 RepID=A0A3S5CG98_9PLAT|nr:unnamed protein product [Protopolystoma xenopodis]
MPLGVFLAIRFKKAGDESLLVVSENHGLLISDANPTRENNAPRPTNPHRTQAGRISFSSPNGSLARPREALPSIMYASIMHTARQGINTASALGFKGLIHPFTMGNVCRKSARKQKRYQQSGFLLPSEMHEFKHHRKRYAKSLFRGHRSRRKYQNQPPYDQRQPTCLFLGRQAMRRWGDEPGYEEAVVNRASQTPANWSEELSASFRSATLKLAPSDDDHQPGLDAPQSEGPGVPIQTGELVGRKNCPDSPRSPTVQAASSFHRLDVGLLEAKQFSKSGGMVALDETWDKSARQSVVRGRRLKDVDLMPVQKKEERWESESCEKAEDDEEEAKASFTGRLNQASRHAGLQFVRRCESETLGRQAKSNIRGGRQADTDKDRRLPSADHEAWPPDNWTKRAGLTGEKVNKPCRSVSTSLKKRVSSRGPIC